MNIFNIQLSRSAQDDQSNRFQPPFCMAATQASVAAELIATGPVDQSTIDQNWLATSASSTLKLTSAPDPDTLPTDSTTRAAATTCAETVDAGAHSASNLYVRSLAVSSEHGDGSAFLFAPCEKRHECKLTRISAYKCVALHI
jgi:hypothetical protein